MKSKYKYILLSLGCVFTFSECDKQLDLQPQIVLTDQNFYQTETDFEAASRAPYSTLLNYYFDQSGMGWYQSQLFPDDDFVPSQGSNNPNEDFLWNANNGDFSWIWQQSYKGIARANTVIENLPKATKFSDEGKKARFEAEARFMRAYFYFILTINFGNVPVVTTVLNKVEDTRVPNSQPGEVWDLIISDLTFAKQTLPAQWDGNNLGRATAGSAIGLLGKTYLYRAQWDNNANLYAKAIEEFNLLVGRYQLQPNYEDNFDINKENNGESVFEIQFSPGGNNAWQPNDFYEPGQAGNDIWSAGTGRAIVWRASCGPTNECAPGANGLGYGIMHISTSLQNEYEPGDPRREATIFQDGDDYLKFYSNTPTKFSKLWSVTGSTPAKYIRKDDYYQNFDVVPYNRSINNDRIIRYADVLLMLAEAKLLGNNDVAGAAELINQVRERADPSKLILIPRPVSVDKDQMMRWLMHERRVELALEGHRYNDLVRWHRAGLINIKDDVDFGRATPQANWSERNLLKPIPQRELDLNTQLKQNPGY